MAQDRKNLDTPAFPTENERQTGPSSYHYEGMTLRDYFAARAMQAAVSAVYQTEGHNWKPGCFAKEAYELADAMLAERAECDANARLIAAAPDLLEALQAIVKSLAGQDDEGMIEHAKQMIDARAAIAKAIGGAQ
jgi:hypothetical protein